MRAEIELRMTTSRSHSLICCKVGGQEDILMENRSLLQSLTSHIITDTSGVPKQAPLSILSMLVPLASDLLSPTVGTNFVGVSDLMSVMSGITAAGRGRGHVILTLNLEVKIFSRYGRFKYVSYVSSIIVLRFIMWPK